MMKLQEIKNFDKTGHEWKFELNGKTYFLTSPGFINDDKIYYSKSNVNGTFRVVGGGMHLEKNEIKPHRVLVNNETSKHFIISGDNFQKEFGEKQ